MRSPWRAASDAQGCAVLRWAGPGAGYAAGLALGVVSSAMGAAAMGTATAPDGDRCYTISAARSFVRVEIETVPTHTYAHLSAAAYVRRSDDAWEEGGRLSVWAEGSALNELARTEYAEAADLAADTWCVPSRLPYATLSQRLRHAHDVRFPHAEEFCD